MLELIVSNGPMLSARDVAVGDEDDEAEGDGEGAPGGFSPVLGGGEDHHPALGDELLSGDAKGLPRGAGWV